MTSDATTTTTNPATNPAKHGGAPARPVKNCPLGRGNTRESWYGAVREPCFVPILRKLKYRAFSIGGTSSAGFAVKWKNMMGDGREYLVYGNANFSIYSRATCNGSCQFCVERLRPASRGVSLERQKSILADDTAYLRKLEAACDATRGTVTSVSITGGEPSLDPCLPAILEVVSRFPFRKRTITTNGSGLVHHETIDLLLEHGLDHVNISRAHWNDLVNQRFMGLVPGLSEAELRNAIEEISDSACRCHAPRPRLSCVLLRDGVSNLEEMVDYLEWADLLGVDNVVFRQLMHHDPTTTTLDDPVVRFSDLQRVELDPILRQLSSDGGGVEGRFEFQRQVVGYYYYVEVFTYTTVSGNKMDVVLEAADLAWIEEWKRRAREFPIIHEFVFHPGGQLCSTWQPWDGILLP